jgi:hypothetical protein
MSETTSRNTPAENLDLFVEAEFAGFNDRNFELLAAGHAEDVRVQMPDGSIVNGREQHMQDLQDMLVWAPDMRVTKHLTKIAQDDWTAAVGVLTGTFSEPMPLPDGGSLPPTRKSLEIQVATFARWENGQIVEESLFWDGASFAAQLGLAG